MTQYPQTSEIRKRVSNRLLSTFHMGMDAFLDLLPLPKRPHILIACMPKSGSTYLTNVISHYEGLSRAQLVPFYGTRENELCQVRLSKYNHRGYAAQLHLRNSGWTQHMIMKYRLTPIVLTRNLFDIVISLRDHFRNESTETSMAYLTPHHLQMSDTELEETITRLVMPWYMNFYAGWRTDANALFVSYEDLITNPEETVAAVLRRSRISPISEKVKEALEKSKQGNNRLNKGVIGRGKKLSPKASEDLLRLLDFYPEFEEDAYFKNIRASAKNLQG